MLQEPTRRRPRMASLARDVRRRAPVAAALIALAAGWAFLLWLLASSWAAPGGG